jgi:hypothetical protein
MDIYTVQNIVQIAADPVGNPKGSLEDILNNYQSCFDECHTRSEQKIHD